MDVVLVADENDDDEDDDEDDVAVSNNPNPTLRNLSQMYPLG